MVNGEWVAGVGGYIGQVRLMILVILCTLLAGCRRELGDAVREQVVASVVDELRTDLRTIMTAQERHFSATGSYAATLDLLRADGMIEPMAGGVVEVVGAPNRFTATTRKSVGAGAVVVCRVTVGSGKETDGLIECN